MSIDRVKLSDQYVQGAGKATNNGVMMGSRKPDFDNTLNNIISGNSANSKLSDVTEENKKQITTGPELDAIFKKAADTYGVPEELLKAMAKAESGFNPSAVSKCGAMGIMQLMPNTAKALGVVDAFNPEQNIMGGASYISQKLKAYDGDITLALAAYNAGSGNVKKYGGVPPFGETQNYIKKIFGYMGEDITLPDQVVQSNDGTKNMSMQGLFGEQTYSDMGTEKAFYAAQIDILKHQIDMQNIFASGQSADNEDEDDENLDINKLIDSLSRL